MILSFALLNMIRGGVFGDGFFIKGKLFFLLAAAALLGVSFGLPGVLAGIGLWGGAQWWGLGVYAGALLDGKYEVGIPKPEVSFIDKLIVKFEGTPKTYGFLGLLLRGLLWGAVTSVFMGIGIFIDEYFFNHIHNYMILLGCLGPVFLPVGFYLSIDKPKEWLLGECYVGAFIGATFELTRMVV